VVYSGPTGDIKFLAGNFIMGTIPGAYRKNNRIPAPAAAILRVTSSF
jgi:hypothetical protein